MTLAERIPSIELPDIGRAEARLMEWQFRPALQAEMAA
jgi:hypothetical protein